MGKQKTRIQLKKDEELAKLLAIGQALSAAKKQEKAAFTGRQKRKGTDQLRPYIGVGLGNLRAIRYAEDYVAKSYNLGRQVIGLVDHVFVRYRTPLFLYRSVLSPEGVRLIFGAERVAAADDCGRSIYREWFFTAAQGGSLAKKMSDLMTKREVHCFLQAPAENSIARNLFWARCFAGGVPARVCQLLTERLASRDQLARLGGRLPDLIRFYANEYSFMRENDLREITDFVGAMIEEQDFSFKGRTFGSMRQLSNDWHRWTFSGKVAVYRSWPQLIDAWQRKHQGEIVRAFELTNNRALGDEGQRQKHCVFSYARLCEEGWCRIVSIRWFVPGADREDKRVTVEVNVRHRQIVQIRGKLNRDVTDEEMKVIKLWAGERGYTIADWAR